MSDIDRDTEYLLWKFVHECMDPGDEERVAEILGRNPELARVLYQLADHRLVLEEGLSRQRKRKTAPIRHSRRTAAPVRRLRIRTGRWLSVAACLAIIVGSLAYNHYQSERFAHVIIARVKESVPNVRIVRSNGHLAAILNMPIYAGDRIETKRNQRITLIYEGENTEVTIHEKTTLDIGGVERGKRLHLETGIIDAAVDPQPAGRQMKITTRHAECDIVGTRLSLAVPRNRTRLDVFEGLAQMTRLSDGKKIAVSTGQFAMVAEGLEFAAMTIPDRDLRRRTITPGPGGELDAPRRALDGKILFEDDFNGSFDNWEVVRGTPVGGFTAVTGNAERFLGFGKKTLRDETETTCLQFNVSKEDALDRGIYFGIRSKRRIAAERFVIEAHMSYYAGGGNLHVGGIENAGEIVTTQSLSVIIPIMPRVYRWEFTPAKDAPRDGMLLCRWSMRNRATDIPLMSFYVSSTTRKILIAFTKPERHNVPPKQFEVYRVVVRELKPEVTP